VESTSKERLLHIELTDDTDPFFLFTLDVTEEHFHELKNDQSLLVDFNGFADKFVELLDLVLNASANILSGDPDTSLSSSPGKDNERPRFMAILNTRDNSSDPRFSIVETNM
jgi:spindle assembly abnormal protein 6